MSTSDDFKKPFPERYLECAQAMDQLAHWLMVVGLGDNRNFKALQADFIRHGGETLRDIQRMPKA